MYQKVFFIFEKGVKGGKTYQEIEKRKKERQNNTYIVLAFTKLPLVNFNNNTRASYSVSLVIQGNIECTTFEHVIIPVAYSFFIPSQQNTNILNFEVVQL